MIPVEIQKVTDDGIKLPVMEEFYTLQGEGFFQGQAAYFIRLGGCAIGCHWCDVKDSWDFTKWPLYNVSDLALKVATSKCRLAVITGGEPTHYNLAPLTIALKQQGVRIHIETSGAYELTGEWDWICLSPKKFKAPEPSIFLKANELKVIIFNKSDFSWALQLAENTSDQCLLYIQAEWSQKHKMYAAMVDFVKENPRWRFSIQMHKYLDIP